MRWQKQQAADVDPILVLLKSKWKANHPEPIGQLKHLEHALLRHVFEQRKQGINVHTLDLVIKASSFSPEFNAKHFMARRSAMKQFLCANLLVRKPKDVVLEASEYINLMCPFHEGPHCNQRFILNMDQMPVFFNMMAKRTLEVISVKTIHIRTLTNDTKHVTKAMTIAADATVLPSMILFKGKPDGWITRYEFATYPTTHHY